MAVLQSVIGEQRGTFYPHREDFIQEGQVEHDARVKIITQHGGQFEAHADQLNLDLSSVWPRSLGLCCKFISSAIILL